jgi:hypothetical protein
MQLIAALVSMPPACGAVRRGAGDDQRLHDDQSARHAARSPIPAGSVADPLVRVEHNTPTGRSHRMSDARAGASAGRPDGVRSARRCIGPSIHGSPITASDHEVISARCTLHGSRAAVMSSRRQVVGDDVFVHLAAVSGIRSSVAWCRDARGPSPSARLQLVALSGASRRTVGANSSQQRRKSAGREDAVTAVCISSSPRTAECPLLKARFVMPAGGMARP